MVWRRRAQAGPAVPRSMPLPSPLRALEERDFRLCWTGQVVSMIGTRIQKCSRCFPGRTTLTGAEPMTGTTEEHFSAKVEPDPNPGGTEGYAEAAKDIPQTL
jgi:hypothetical protein